VDARPDFATILDVLSQHGVSFLVVGGVAAVLSGAPVNTLDTDVLVERSPENLKRLLAALVALDATYRDPAHRRIEPTVERLKGLGQQQLTTRFGPLDVLGTIGNQRTYDELRSRIVEMPLRGRVVRVLELGAVIESKEEANRPKDLAVLPVLRETLAARRKRGER